MQVGDLQFWGFRLYCTRWYVTILCLSLSEAKDAGVNMYVMANNHSMDRGPEGLRLPWKTCVPSVFTAGAYLNQEERYS